MEVEIIPELYVGDDMLAAAKSAATKDDIVEPDASASCAISNC